MYACTLPHADDAEACIHAYVGNDFAGRPITTPAAGTQEDAKGHRHSQKAGKGVKAKDAEASAGEDNDVTKDVWLRKIRMGTFEDSGACKG
jgi:hypothetical protein